MRNWEWGTLVQPWESGGDNLLFSILMRYMLVTIDISDALLRELRDVSGRERRAFRAEGGM